MIYFMFLVVSKLHFVEHTNSDILKYLPKLTEPEGQLKNLSESFLRSTLLHEIK